MRPKGPASVGRPKRLHEFVVDELGSRIVRGDLQPWQALPIEDSLARDLGVSRTVVREAIKVLAQKQLLTVRTRTGTRISPTAEWNHLDPDILRWRFAGALDAKFVANVIELRRIIEPAAAELAATRATSSAVRAIQVALEQMTTTADVKAHIAADIRFHLAILEAAGNDLLLGLRTSIEGALNFAIHLSTLSKDDGASSLALHRAVYEAIATRKPSVARAAMDRIVDQWVVDSRRVIAATSKQTTAAESRRESYPSPAAMAPSGPEVTKHSADKAQPALLSKVPSKEEIMQFCNGDRKKLWHSPPSRSLQSWHFPRRRGRSVNYVARMSIEVQEGHPSKSPWNASRSSLAKTKGEVEIKKYSRIASSAANSKRPREVASVQSDGAVT